MQTFVPYGEDFRRNAQVLDRQRLGKQRVEAFQILRALRGETKGWVNHPATRMWRGHETMLNIYGQTMCQEWIERGYQDNLLDRFKEMLPTEPFRLVYPEWLKSNPLIYSHRSNLVRKMPEHYGPIWHWVSPDLPYVWPV